jgi:predicted amidohydrolase
MKAALLQLTSSDNPAENRRRVLGDVEKAVGEGAEFVLTPEVTNCVSANRAHQQEVLRLEQEDETLAALRNAATQHGIHLLIGSLALKTDDPDGRFANRSFLIGPDGEVSARYDKIHMFDVQVSAEETYRESAGYRPGTQAVVARTPWGVLGMTICYDVRFPMLFQRLALFGATMITVPSAFSPVTGAAHWESLLRARAIETGCFVFAPAQTGTHIATQGKQRRTYGHSMVISPWGEVVLDAGTEAGIFTFDIDPDEVQKARAKVPSLSHIKEFNGPV